jgi:hypothetical protein
MAVCGQAPVSTAITRAGSIRPLRLTRSASSFVTRSLVMTAMSVPRLIESGDELLEQGSLARAHWTPDTDARGAWMGPSAAVSRKNRELRCSSLWPLQLTIVSVHALLHRSI